MREKYHIAKVAEVFPGKDGKVRKVTIVYKTLKQGEKMRTYKGAHDTSVSRSAQRLALLVPSGGADLAAGAAEG